MLNLSRAYVLLFLLALIFHLFFYFYLISDRYPVDILESYLNFSEYNVLRDINLGEIFYLKEFISWSMISAVNIYIGNVKIISYFIFMLQIFLIPKLIVRYGSIILIWFCLPFVYYLDFNGLRQAISLTFLMLSLSASGNFNKYLFFVAALFSHNSSIIYILRELSVKNIWKSIILIVVAFSYYFYIGGNIEYNTSNIFGQLILISFISFLYFSVTDAVLFIICACSFFLTDFARFLYFPLFLIYERTRINKLESNKNTQYVFVVISIGSIYFALRSLGVIGY
jgi:hypothetical protein